MPEPSPASFVSVSLMLVMAGYHAKDARALSSRCSCWSPQFGGIPGLDRGLLTQSPTPTRAPGVQAAAKIGAYVLHVLAAAAERSCFSFGVMFGW